MDKFKLFIYAFCTLLYITNNVETTKLNYPRVLLPIFDKISINFTLEVIEKGCFKWMSSRQDLILITPQYDDFESECSSKAVVTVLSRERRRNTAIVLAEDTATTEVLRCDVILDVIDQLRVLTTTRELYLEEAPETFELWAQDSQGNAFTTLEGVEFDWKISPVGQDAIDHNDWQAALRFLTFTESSYHEVPRSLEKFEALHMKGYMILLEGINTGTAKVTVRIPYPEYSTVPINEVYINVLANIILDPSDVHILAGDTVNFRILQLKQGKLQEISLNNQYYLQIEDMEVATIRGSKATGSKLGRTFVVLRDRNVPSEGSYTGDSNAPKSPVPRATLTVSEPKKLTVNLLPHYNWMTVEGEKHEIAVDIYAKDNQKITLGPKYSVNSQLDESLFYVLKKSQNGSRIYGEAVKEGSSPVHAAFKDLTAKAELQIFKELLLAPSKVILPFDPNAPKTQKVQFRATGGDGSYLWTSQHPSLLQISPTGLASTRIDSDLKLPSDVFDERSKAILTNHANVRVALARNVKISRTAEIYFLPPVKLEIVQYNFETALRDYVKLHIAVYAFTNDSYVPFTKCENLNFNLEFSNQIFQIDSMREEQDTLAPSACHIIYLRSTSIGMAHFSVSYKFMDRVLKDEVTLMVFEKLNILNPIENEIILPIGSSRNLLYVNGPQKIFTLAAELTKNLQYDKDIAGVSEIQFDSPRTITAFTVLCRKVGQTTLSFDAFNSMQAKNFEPYISNYMTTIYCVKPRFLNLYATEQLRQSCPMEMKNSLMHLKDKEDKFEIEIEIQDAKNRRLMNISSLLIEWQFAQEGENYHKDIFYFRESDEEIIEGVRLPGRDILISTIKEVTSNFKVKGIVTNYDAAILAKHSIKPESPAFGIKKAKTEKLTTPVIENEIKFMAVNSTMFPSEHISIFLAKNRPHKVPIQQGSGYYDFQVSESGVISIDFDAKRRELIVTPHRIGHVRIELTDLCLMTEPAHLSVSVVSIGSIKVEVPDRVERTKSIDAIVKLYDSNDNLLLIDPYNLQIYELTEDIFNPNILSVNLGDQLDLEMGEIRYTVTGSSLGESKVVFNSGRGEFLVSSIPANIQVFPPLRLYPRNSTLVIGSSVQIYYQGGPQPDVNIIYSVHDQSVISMESALVVARKLGHTKITGKCISYNPSNGKEVIISIDTVEIHVVPLLNIQIKTPLVRIKSGAVMPAFIWGLSELTPMVLGTLENMRVIWSSNQLDVVDIYNVFSEAGIEYSDKDLISVRIKALNPGKAKIQATVILPSGQRLTASVEVVVFKMLELDSPKRITMDSILIAPRSTIQLKANLDDVVYKSDSDAANGIVRVSSDGIVRSGDTLGRDLIIARTYEQTLPIGIEVKNVQYILASLQYPSIKLKQTEEKIPRGMNFVLKVSLHDNLGNEFSHNIEDVNGIKYDLSHKDIVDVQIGNNLTVAVRIELTDLCLMTEPAHLSVSVVSIGSIKVEVPDRVERTKSIDAIVKLYDSNDNLLLIDPYNLQIYELTEDIFNPNILSVNLGDQLDLEMGEIRYTVTGSSLGESKVVFNSGRGEFLVSSIPANIQVFPPLRLYPRNSTLVIGSSVQIYYQGGPQPDVNIIYSVHDQSVISMESALVVARKLGHTKITGKCISYNPSNGKEVIISIDTVEIHVVPLLNIQIKTPLVRIKSGAVMPAFIWGLSELTPMVLGTLENMRVIWSSNQLDVVDIYNVFSEAGIEYSDKDLISVRIKALNPGKAKIQATVILPSGQRLTASVEVVVFKMLELDSPKRITMDSILIAPRSTIQLKANLDDVVYKSDSDAANGIVRVSSDGIVRSGDTLGRDLIIARTYEQTLPIGIEVKNVQYILASLQYPSIKLKQTEEKIPRGMNFVLKVSLHDNLGNEFSHNIEDVNGIKYDLSHKDIVDVQIGNNLTVAINLPRETSNMIAISLKDTTGVKHAEDYIKLSVSESRNIFPTKTIFSVGDIICFDSPLTSSSYWTSSDEHIVSIDSNTGVGKVLGNRFKLGEKVVVTNGDKTGSFLKYDVEVRDADKIEFFKSFDIFSGTSYRGHLIVRNHLQVDKFANLIAKNISKCSNLIDKVPIKFFTCRLTSKQQQLGSLLLDHYKVIPDFDAELGTYACQIDLTTTFNDVLNIVKTNEVNFELEAQLPNGLTDVITLKFVPGIRVTPAEIYDADIGQQDIIITGLDKVLQKIEVQTSDPSILEVIPQAKIHGSLQYKVKQLNQLPTEEQLFIYVHSPLTLQDIEIPILGSSNALQQKCSNQPFSNSSTFLYKALTNVGFVIVSSLIILAATIWVLIVCSPQRRSTNSSGGSGSGSYRTDINSEVFSTSAKNKSLNSSSSSPAGLGVDHPGVSFSSPRTAASDQLYPNLSSYYAGNKSDTRSSGGVNQGLSPGNESPVYGDTTLISPQKRINRRYI